MSRRVSKSSRRKTDKYAKHKMMAIPFLLLILGYVVLDSFSSSDSNGSAVTTTTVSSPASRSTQRPSGAAAAVKDPSSPRKTWPSPTLALLELESPFSSYIAHEEQHRFASAGSIDLRSPQGDANRVAAAFDADQVPYVFQSGNTKKAILNGKLVKPGEDLGGGVELRDIESGQLILHVSNQSSQVD